MQPPKRKKSKRAKHKAQRGPRGHVGRPGTVGPAGPAGPAGRDHTNRIDRINRELEVQLVRIGQLQAELDRLQTAFKEIQQQVIRADPFRRESEEARGWVR